MFAGKFVWIKISKGYWLQIYSQSNKLIAVHKLSLKKGSTIIIQEHYKSSRDSAESFKALNFLEEAKNILFIRAFGAGKTHLATSLGVKAVQARKRVLFYTAEQLTLLLASSEVSGNLNKTLDSLSRVDLIIIDELG